MNFSFTHWLFAFALTQLVEAPIYLRALPRRRVPYALLPSAVTHPMVWYVWPPLWFALLGRPAPGSLSQVCLYIFIEGFALAAEALILRSLGVARPWRWSLLANAASFGVGLLCSAVFGWP